jgi:hypothetical protein
MKPLVFKDPHLHLFKVHTAGAIKYISLRNWGRAITTLIVGERAELRLNPNTAVFSASGEARILRQDGRVDVVELARQAGGSLLAIYDVPNAEQRPQTGIRRRACPSSELARTGPASRRAGELRTPNPVPDPIRGGGFHRWTGTTHRKATTAGRIASSPGRQEASGCSMVASGA